MGNGALPNGSSYRAHPRLYRQREAGPWGFITLAETNQPGASWRASRDDWQPSWRLISPVTRASWVPTRSARWQPWASLIECLHQTMARSKFELSDIARLTNLGSRTSLAL